MYPELVKKILKNKTKRMADVYRNHVFHGGRSGKEVLEIPARYGCREERKKKEAETEGTKIEQKTKTKAEPAA